MDRATLEEEFRRSGSFGRLCAASSSRRQSLSITASAQFDDTIESESVSEAGDIGDRVLHSNRCSGSGRSHFSLHNVAENAIVFPIQDNNLLHSSLQSDLESMSTFSIEASAQKNKDKEDMHLFLEYITYLLALAVFGILGVLARYGLQKLFGPGEIGATSDQSYMYLDLPSNMVGSFLMGWLGVVFKGDISKISDQLAVGLSTGFLGSLTTFSGWNQKMLDLSVEGRWAFAVLGIFIGLFLVAYSIIIGIETAKGARWLYRTSFGASSCLDSCNSMKYRCLLTFMMILILMLAFLWGLFGALLKKEFENSSSKAQLFLACMIGPFGVWIRWFLARYNGHGIVKWMPVGTLAANVLAASVMAALATLRKAVNNKHCDTVASGIQLGLLGCLSTVSTFIAEFHAMRESTHPWRAYAYASTTIGVSYLLGTFIYSIPVWVRGYS